MLLGLKAVTDICHTVRLLEQSYRQISAAAWLKMALHERYCEHGTRNSSFTKAWEWAYLGQLSPFHLLKKGSVLVDWLFINSTKNSRYISATIRKKTINL